MTGDYLEGYKQALWDYAWLREGKYYVGLGVLTYQEALEEAMRDGSMANFSWPYNRSAAAEN
jgi:hypothetical protein